MHDDTIYLMFLLFCMLLLCDTATLFSRTSERKQIPHWFSIEKCMLYGKFESLSSYFILEGIKSPQFYPASRNLACRIPKFMENVKCSQCFLPFPPNLKTSCSIWAFSYVISKHWKLTLPSQFFLLDCSFPAFLSFLFTFRLLHYSLLFHFRVDIGIFLI